MENGYVITTTAEHCPILIKEDDTIIINQLRFSGVIQSLFDDVALFLAQKNDIVIEIGAHFGYNVLRICRVIGNEGKFYAYEPNSMILSCLRKNVVLNDIEHIVRLKGIAVSKTFGSCNIPDVLSIYKKANGTLSQARMMVANCNTLDNDLINEHEAISLLLIDIPGKEFDIIRGAKDIITNSKDIKILIDMNVLATQKNTNIKTELKDLQQKGFNFYKVVQGDIYEKINIESIIAEKQLVVIVSRKQP